MVDNKDFNKPNLDSNYLSEVLETIRGNINRVASRDPGTATNVPIGFKKIEDQDGNLKILNHRGNNNYETVFDFKDLVQKAIDKRIKGSLNHPTFEFANEADFTPWVQEGTSPGTIATTRSGDIKLKVTRAGWANIMLVAPGRPNISTNSMIWIRFQQLLPKYQSSSLYRTEISGSALPNAESKSVINHGSYSSYSRSVELASNPINLLVEDFSTGQTRQIPMRIKVTYASANINFGAVMDIPFIEGFPYARYDLCSQGISTGNGISYQYELPHFGLQTVPFVKSNGDPYGPVYVNVGFGGSALSIALDGWSSSSSISATSYETQMLYLSKGDLTISISANDQLLQACINQSFPAPDGGSYIKYNPWIHTGLPGGRGIVIIEPLARQE